VLLLLARVLLAAVALNEELHKENAVAQIHKETSQLNVRVVVAIDDIVRHNGEAQDLMAKEELAHNEGKRGRKQ